jgi:integrase
MARKAAPVEGVYEREVGSGLWYARFRNNTKLVRKAFGRDRAAAIAWVEKSRTLLRDGAGAAPTTAKQIPMTSSELAEQEAKEKEALFGGLADAYLDHIRANPKEYRDQKNPPSRIGRIKQSFGHRLAPDISSWEISDWLDGLKVSPGTRNRYQSTFSGIFRYAKKRGKLLINPVRDVDRAKVPDPPIRWMDDDEETVLRKVLQDDVDACGKNHARLRKRLLHHVYELDIALGTGMRRGEMYTITKDQVYFNRREIRLDITKNGSSRIVEMNDDVMAAMKGLIEIPMIRKSRSAATPNSAPTDSVFALSDPKKWFEKAVKKAKLRKLRWHDLRHTYCSRLAQKGVNQVLIMKAAGHKSIQSSLKYTHLDKKALTEAVALLNRTL